MRSHRGLAGLMLGCICVQCVGGAAAARAWTPLNRPPDAGADTARRRIGVAGVAAGGGPPVAKSSPRRAGRVGGVGMRMGRGGSRAPRR